jgi:hypothetical protein
MDIRSIANSCINVVNPDIPVTVKKATGYTIGTGAKQIPTYATGVVGMAQLQALDSKELQQLDGLNINGTIKGIYLRGVLAGVIRPNQTGGDLILIGAETWLVVKVFEGWAGWTKCAICLQVT